MPLGLRNRIVPALRVKPPWYEPPDKAKTPAPSLMKPTPAAVEIDWPAKSSVEPLPTVKIRTLPPVANVPTFGETDTETLFESVMFPTSMTAPIPAKE
jgi:hypothetical protein